MALLDLHAHFPMHTRFPPRFTEGPPPVDKELEYWVAQHLLNYQNGNPRVSLQELVDGAPGGIASVLYDPDDEFFRDANPRPEAFPNLLAQMDNVEAEIQGDVTLARNPAQVRACLERSEKFLVHCVERAFGLGGVASNVEALAHRGVAYVVVAHLFYRGVATCTNAIPFLPDIIFDVINPQPDVGLTPLGRDIVSGLLDNRILVDITTSSSLAQDQIFQIAADYRAPVISSHTGVRPTSDYPLNLSPETVLKIKDSKGVIGVIIAPHWLRQRAQDFFPDGHIELVLMAIDAIQQITDSFDQIAIGTDLDGFIKPVDECPDWAHTTVLASAIEAKYGTANAEKILWRNALDVLERWWKGTTDGPRATAAPAASETPQGPE